MKSDIGYLINTIRKYDIMVPTNSKEFVGIIKRENMILFELDSNSPKSVWKKNGNSDWRHERFIGYPLIEEFSLKEFELKYDFIEQALKRHWDDLLIDPNNIHGDFTHFNILIDESGNISFIDDKRHKNSRLFDFFYFYAYLRQSLYRCQTLSRQDRKKIITQIESIIVKICQYQKKEELIADCKQITIPKSCGLIEKYKIPYLHIFFNLF